MTQRYNFQPYDFTLTPGGSQTILVMGEYFRIQAATGAVTVTVEGYGKLPGLLTGQGLQRVPYSRLILTDASGAANAGVILCSGAEFVDNRTYGVNSLDNPTIVGLKTPLIHTGFTNVIGALAANTPEVIFSPAANANGAIVLSAECSDFGTACPGLFFLARGFAPTTQIDGLSVLRAPLVSQGASGFFAYASMFQPQYLPAGLGLYFLVNAAASNGCQRSARFRLL